MRKLLKNVSFALPTKLLEMKNTLNNLFENKFILQNFNTILVGLALLLCILPLSKTWSQCGSEPFPDQWSVHQIQSSELPYRSVYIYANTDIDGDGRKKLLSGTNADGTL